MTKFKVAAIVIVFGAMIALYNNCGGARLGAGLAGGTPQTRGTEVLNPFNPAAAALLPKVFLNSDYPVVTGRTLTVGKTGRNYNSCQSAVDAAQPGDEIVIDAGFKCKPFVLRNKGATSQYVLIRSSSLSMLAEGRRVTHADAASMAVVESQGNPAVSTETGANHYYLAGFEIRFASAIAKANDLIRFGSGSETSLSDLPYDIVVSRSWVHGFANQEVNRGVTLNGSAISVVDSVIDDIHALGNPTQAISGWNTGTGPFKIVNNDLAAAGNNFGVGGDFTTIQGLIPSDIEFRKNFVHKPLAWRDPVTTLSGTTGNWYIQTLLKLANAQRVLIEGNLFEDDWKPSPAYSEAQGVAIYAAPRSSPGQQQPGALPWVRVQDVTIRDNVIRHCAGALEIEYQDVTFPSVIAQRFNVMNNLMYDIGGTWGQESGVIRLRYPSQDQSFFGQNTVLTQAAMDAVHAGSLSPDHVFVNNIFGGPISDTQKGSGAVVLDQDFPQVVFEGNVNIGVTAASYGAYAQGNFFASGVSDVGFLAQTFPPSDFSLFALSNQSPYYLKGVGGASPGVNVPELQKYSFQ